MSNPKHFFYFIKKGKYSICDFEYCAKSERTIDISFYDLANHEELLGKLNLYYMKGNYGIRYTYKTRAEWFAGYLAAFYSSNRGQREKSLTNPTVRILIEDNKLLEQVKSIINKPIFT